ncbi:papain-like cysteine protease family protein [Paraburkholderia silviterrae]|nr:papain-like cysteine protease family protein [Paraburkholderia silviterrae]
MANSELVAVDSDGNYQFVWMQELRFSCGPACVYMIERIKKQACPAGGEERIRQITALLPEGYSEAQGGTQSYNALALALQAIGFSATAILIEHFRDFLALASFPFITRIGWPDGSGHFVVCVACTRNAELVCLDPWGGLTQPKLQFIPVYQVLYQKGGVFSGHTVVLT